MRQSQPQKPLKSAGKVNNKDNLALILTAGLDSSHPTSSMVSEKETAIFYPPTELSSDCIDFCCGGRECTPTK